MFAGNDPERIFLFRKELIREFIDKNHEVIICEPFKDKVTSKKIEELGVQLKHVKLKRVSKNVFYDLLYFFNLIKVMKTIKPDILITVTIKPNVYGSIAARFVGVKQKYALMVGAGSFLRNNKRIDLLNHLTKPLFKNAYNNYDRIFFLNNDDKELFKKLGFIKKTKYSIIGSSGVNLNYFKKTPLQCKNTFLFIGRLLKDKGIYEYLAAAEQVKRKYPQIIFNILGSFDCNPTSIKKELIEEYEKKGVIDYLGYKTDVRPYIKNSYAVVLPSYHEGQGRVLAEGMAMGRPVIASDVPGCRQTVRNKVNGLLVPPKDYKALADAMIYLYKNPETGIKMGEEGYKIAKEVFDVDKINEKILNEMGIIS